MKTDQQSSKERRKKGKRTYFHLYVHFSMSVNIVEFFVVYDCMYRAAFL